MLKQKNPDIYPMPTIYCTKKLAQFIHKNGLPPIQPEAPSPLGDWNGHLFYLDRKKGLVFVNNRTWYSVFITDIVKKDMADFNQLFLSRVIQQMMHDLHLTNKELAVLENHFGPVRLADTNNDRRTLGIINDLIYTFKIHYDIKYGSEEQMPVLYENNIMNDTIRRGSKGYSNIFLPIEAMKNLMKELA
jgi:hypothetical protein